MGNYFSFDRRNRDDVGDSTSHNAYRYPPKTGNYFSNHFIMGGERFESPQPAEYLFGESEELNFLGNKPLPFPYPPPQGSDPTKTLKALVYIRKDSLRLVKCQNVPQPTNSNEDDASKISYNIEFMFDSDVKCSIQIYYFASEELVNGQLVYHPRDSTMTSEAYHYKRGAGQQFSQPAHVFEPGMFSEEEWQYSFEKDVFPIAIHCTVDDEEHLGHSHVTYAVLERGADGGHSLKPLKQKQAVDGLAYLLQEIYGIENKNMERLKDVDPDEDIEDSGAECVICMSDMRDTLILPCRHLCLCSTCADSLRYQASMCPICRVKFKALLQIRAMRKKVPSTNLTQPEGEEPAVSQEGVPAGYEAISLIEALNGQVVPPASHEGVHLHLTGPPALFSLEKKGQKDKHTVTGPIEYQKELSETDKESSKGGTLEKKDKGSKDGSSPEARPRLTKDKATTPLKSTVVTVRCAADGSLTTETRISATKESQLHSGKARTTDMPQRGPFKPSLELAGGRLTAGLSTGDMADDELEDSSEPEADYDDGEELVGEALPEPPVCLTPGSLSSDTEPPAPPPRPLPAHDRLSAAELGENYDPLLAQAVSQSTDHTDHTDQPCSLTDVPCSSGSSLASQSSSHALLTSGEVTPSDPSLSEAGPRREGPLEY